MCADADAISPAQAVIFAAPYHQTGVSVHNSPVPSLIPRQPYVHLHVTFIITNATTPLASYFNLSDSTTMPNTIFGTFDTPSPSPPTFNSLNYLKPLPASIGARFGNDSTWHVVKMFSSYTLGESMLDDLFGRGNVGKKWEKVWASYPQLRPVESENELAPVRPDEGFYYVNGFERLISTMETEVRWRLLAVAFHVS